MSSPRRTLECGACCLLFYEARLYQTWVTPGTKFHSLEADLSTPGCKKPLAQRSLDRSAGAARHLKPSMLAEVQLNTRIASDRKEIDKMRASLRLIVTLSL